MIDGFILFVLFVMFVVGFSRGTLHELWSLAVLALSTYLSGSLYLSFTDLAGRFILNENGSRLASFALVFIVVSSVLNGPVEALIRHRRGRWDEKSSFADRTAGSILGVVEAIGTIEVAASVLTAFPVLTWDGWVASSHLLGTFFSQWPLMMPLLPSTFQSVLQLFK